MGEPIEDIYVFVGDAVRKARKQAGISQEDLALFLNISRPSIGNMEAGRQRIALHHLFEIAKATGVELSAFLPSLSGEELQASFNVSREERKKFEMSKAKLNKSVTRVKTALWNALTQLDNLSS